MTRNAWGLEIPQIQEILNDKRIEAYIRQTLDTVLQHVGVCEAHVVDEILTHAKSLSFEDYEITAHATLERCKATEKIPLSLTSRAQLIYEQIKPHIKGDKVLDYGCGDAKVGILVAHDGKTVMLKDVYEHSNIEDARSLGLEFRLIIQGEPLPDASETYDTTLLLTVLHHSSFPLQTLQEAQRVTRKGGHILIIESVYGIDDTSAFGQLTHEEQRLANIFFDHFYNRVLHYSTDPTKKVNVPFNFNTPQGWTEEVQKRGMKSVALAYLGIDQKAVPEYHTLHVIQV